MAIELGSGSSDVSAEKTISALNALLRGELAAVETYRQALDKVEDTQIRSQLQQVQGDHQRRVTRLQQIIMQAGGTPSEGSGAWGAFAKLIEGSAKLFGDKAAISALEEGEDHGLRDYRDKLDSLDATHGQIVRTELLSAQERTHATLSALKKTIDLH